MQSGELIVSGTDSVKIILRGAPVEAHAKFKDCQVVIPCNSGSVDYLEYEIVHHHNHYALIIRWGVAGVREIKWHVSY